MQSLQVESLLILYNQLSKAERLSFLAKIDETSIDFREAAIVIELDRKDIKDPLTRQLIQNDTYIQKDVIIDQDLVEHVSDEIADRISRAKYITAQFGKYFSSEPAVWSYIILEFDPLDGVKRANEECWTEYLEKFEPFDISKLDVSIGPMYWTIYDNDGCENEIMPHP